MTVLTGPKASTSCGSARLASSPRTSSGEMNAPWCASAPVTWTCSGSPKTSCPADSRDFNDRRTSSRWSRLASAPIRTVDRVQLRGGHEGPADRRAFLPGLHRHLGDELPDVQVELGGAGRGVRA